MENLSRSVGISMYQVRRCRIYRNASYSWTQCWAMTPSPPLSWKNMAIPPAVLLFFPAQGWNEWIMDQKNSSALNVKVRRHDTNLKEAVRKYILIELHGTVCYIPFEDSAERIKYSIKTLIESQLRFNLLIDHILLPYLL